MDDKDFFAKLAGVGPDGKFSSFSYAQKKAQAELAQGAPASQFNGEGKRNGTKEIKTEIEDGEPEGQLAIDVYETASSFVLEAPVAGVKADDLDVAITVDSITVRGRRAKENGNASGEKDYLFAECFWGKFARTISLPREIDADRASASFRNGVLKIVLPKLERDKPKKIKVRME